MSIQAEILVRLITDSGLSVDDLITAADKLPETDLLQFCLISHNLRHAAMAVSGRRGSEFDVELEKLWHQHYNVPMFCFSRDVIGGKIKEKELSQELLDGLDDLESLL